MLGLGKSIVRGLVNTLRIAKDRVILFMEKSEILFQDDENMEY